MIWQREPRPTRRRENRSGAHNSKVKCNINVVIKFKCACASRVQYILVYKCAADYYYYYYYWLDYLHAKYKNLLSAVTRFYLHGAASHTKVAR